MKKKKAASAEALEAMRKADGESTWTGRFRCCNKPVTGTPADIAKEIKAHLEGGCDGASNRPHTTDQPANQ